MASANLVLELSIIMLALLGWQLTLAEFVGPPLMVVLLALLFRMFLSREGRPRRNGPVRHGGTSLARASAGAPRKATGHCLRLWTLQACYQANTSIVAMNRPATTSGKASASASAAFGARPNAINARAQEQRRHDIAGGCV